MSQRVLVRGWEIRVNISYFLQESLPFILEIRAVEKCLVDSIELLQLQIGFGKSQNYYEVYVNADYLSQRAAS